MHRPLERVNNMKPPTTESKGTRPRASRVKSSAAQSSAAKSSAAKSSVQTPVKRLAKTLASIAAKSDASTKSDKEKKQGQRAKQSQAKAEDKSGEVERGGGQSHSKAEQSRKNPVPNVPFIKDSKAARVTFTLLLVRPWVLVAGLWLVSLLGSAIAIQGLIRPKVLMQALPEATVEAPPVVTSSLISVAEGDPESGETNSSEADSEAEATESTATENADAEAADIEAADSGGFPLWTLSALTGTCAAGCLIMSRRRAMARLSAARAKSRTRRKPVRADAARPIETAQSLKQARKPVPPGTAESARKVNSRPVGAKDAEVRSINRVKKRRQRSRRAAGQTSGTQTLVSKGNLAAKGRKQAQRAATHAHPARPRRVKRVSSARVARQGMVSVVPASESHALDWTDGSLAHQMDVRSHRKAM